MPRPARRRTVAAVVAATVLSTIGVIAPRPAATSAAPAGAAPASDGTIGAGPTERYLDAVFDLFVQRDPTAAELDAWAVIVHADQRSAVTGTLAASDEWAGRRVDDLYRRALRRPADAAGRAHWVGRIADGLRLEDVATLFYGSDEYFARHDRSPGPFVDALYLDLLGRSPDAAGRAHWLRLLDGGMPRSTVTASFVSSVESRHDRVAARYAEILGRAPDAGGHRHWAERLLHIGEVELAALLAASPEFHLRATDLPVADISSGPVGPGTAHPLAASWRPGCPVHHRDLRAVEFPHLRDDGTVTRGVVVVHRAVVDQVTTVVRTLYGSGFPLTGARPVDDFGGDDDRSMAADNSSAFNCRTVAGTTTWSQHAYGTAIDLNPERNPHVAGDRVDPPGGAAWLDRDDVRPGMVVGSGPVVAAFDRIGWGWGGRWRSTKDHQHFSASGR